GLGEERNTLAPVPLTDMCQQQLKSLCQKIVGGPQSKLDLKRKQGWLIQQHPGPELCPAGEAADSASQLRKRREAAEESLGPEEDKQRKRPRLDKDELGLEPLTGGAFLKGAGATEDGTSMEVSSHESVQSQIKWQTDGTAPPELQTLNECSPGQALCLLLQLAACPEHTLVRFCTWLLALMPELSYRNAAILTEQLFLQRVLSLTQPASRHLIAALTSFCSKYARPVCCALIAPALQAPGAGELVAGPSYRRRASLRLGACAMQWPLLSVFSLFSMLVSMSRFQVDLPPELFNLLVLKLCRLAPEFAKSLNYAKLMMTVLSVYRSN
uniref:Fanconi Anaemia group E protein C-terminal domain-containing protein n=1 Tax=Pelusios castaneus TaxID=367368 RepID=A0A8C8RX68_9SAUR